MNRICGFSFFMVTVMMLASLSLPARADDEMADGAVAFIGDFSQRSLTTLTKNSLSEKELREVFGKLYDEAFDHRTIARFSLGRYNRTITPQQYDEFTDLFRSFLVASYALRFRQYGGEILILDSPHKEAENLYLVDSRFRREGADDYVIVAWRVGWNGKRYKIYDMNIVGVSLGVTLRAEIASLIKNKGGIEGMLEILRAKVKKIEGVETEAEAEG